MLERVQGDKVEMECDDHERHAGLVPASAVPQAPRQCDVRRGGLRHEAG